MSLLAIPVSFIFGLSVSFLHCFFVFLKLSALLYFPALFLISLLYLCFFFPPSSLQYYLFCLAFFPSFHSHFLLISLPPFSSTFLSYFAQSPNFFSLSLPSRLLYSCITSIFYIYISSPLITFRPLSLFPSHLFLPSSKLSAFLSSPLAFSSSFCLYPHLSPLPASLSPSVFVLAVLAYSAGSSPAMPIILTEEKEKEKEKGKEGRRREEEEGESWKTCACMHRNAQIPHSC